MEQVNKMLGKRICKEIEKNEERAMKEHSRRSLEILMICLGHKERGVYNPLRYVFGKWKAPKIEYDNLLYV